MASQSFNARGGISVGLTGTSVISETGFGTFPVGISAAGATFTGDIAVNGESIFSRLSTFNAGISAAGVTLSGNINLVNTLNGTSVQVTSNARSWFL